MAKGSTKGSFNDLHKELMKDVDNFKNDIRKQVADDIAKGLSDLNIDVSTGEVKVNVEVDDAKISVDAKKQVEKAVSQTVHPEIEVEPTIKFKKIKGIDISEFINYDKNKLKAQIEELLDKSIDDDSLSSKLNKKLYSAIKVGEAKGFLNLKSKDNIDLKMFIDEFQQANKLTQKEINEINNQINNINLTPVKNTISDINTEVSKVDFNPIKENAEKVIDPITNKIKNLNDALGEYNNIISKMKRPAFHVGNIDDDHLADHLWDKKSLERIGSGLFFQHDLEQALADFDILKSQNKNPKLYITDLGNLSGKMKDLRSEDQYEEYIRYLGLINNFILKTANIADTAPNEKVLSKANIKSLDDLYTEGKQYFDHYNVTRDRLSAIINEAVQYVKSSPKDAKNLDDLSSFFQQKAFNLKGVSTHSLPYLDNSSVGSVVFHPNELKELFSINSPYEIAQSIVKQIIERSIKDKAANPNNTREDLDNLFYNYTNSDAIRNLISTDELKKIFDQSYLINGFSQLTEAAKESGQSITTFIENIKNGTIKAEDEITELANSLKNISNLENGTRHTDGFISDTYTLIGRDMEYLQKTEALIPLLEEAENRGVRVGTIIGTIADAENNLYYEIQKTQSGEIIDSSNLGFLEATDDEIQELIKHLNILQELGLFVDTGGQNLLYEKGKGFSFIDLAVPKDINKVPDYLKNTVSGIADSLEEYLPFDKNFKILDEYADKFEKFKSKITTSLSPDKNNLSLDNVSNIDELNAYIKTVDIAKASVEELQNIIAKSHNIGAYWDIVSDKGVEIADRFSQLGYTITDDGENFIQLADKIGRADISLHELLQEYSTFSNTNGAENYTQKISDAILALIESEGKLDTKNLQRFYDLLESIKTNGYSKDIQDSLMALSNKTPDLLDSSSAIQQYIDSLEKVDTKSKEIQEAIKLSRKNDNAGSSLDTLQNLQNEIELTREVREEQEKINQAKKEQDLSFEDGITEKQVNILDEYIDRLATSQARTEENKNSILEMTTALQKSNQAREDASIEKEVSAIDEYIDGIAKTQARSEENKQSIIEMTEALRKSNEEREKQTALDSEFQNFAKLGQMVDEVRQAIEKKTEAFVEEGRTVDKVVESELQALKALIDMLQTAAKNIQDLQNGFANLDLNKTADLSWIKEIKKLKPEDLTKASEALKSMFEAVKGLDIGDSNFLASINSILNKGKELQDFAKIVTSSQEAINAVKANTVEKETTEELLKQKQLQEELLYLDQQQAEYERLRKQYEEEGIRQQQEVINAQKKADNEALIQAYKEADEYLAREKAYIEERNRALAEGAKQAKEYANSLKEAEKAEKKSNENYNKTLEQLQNKLNTISNKNLNQAGLGWLEKFQNDLNSLKTDRSEEELKALEAQIKETFDGNNLKNFQLASANTVAQVRRQAEEFLAKATSLSPERKAQVQEIIMRLDAGPAVSEANNLKAALANVKAEAAKAGETGKRFIDIVKERLIGVNAQLIAQYLSWQDLIRYARTAFNTIRELDYALVDLAKTTTMSKSEMNDFYLGANDVAKQMGVTTKEIIEQAASWSRLGYSSKEAATEMAALSSQFAAISPGMNIENATDGLVSTMKAFHIEVNDAERDIMDNVNRIGNTMATSNDEIVEMLKRSSAAMQAANNTIEETIALESAAVQITRNAETTGTAFRTEFVLVYSNMHYAYI